MDGDKYISEEDAKLKKALEKEKGNICGKTKNIKNIIMCDHLYICIHKYNVLCSLILSLH